MDLKQKIVQFRAPELLSEVISETASKNFQTRSEYIRRSIVERLKADGVNFEVLSTAQVLSLSSESAGDPRHRQSRNQVTGSKLQQGAAR